MITAKTTVEGVGELFQLIKEIKQQATNNPELMQKASSKISARIKQEINLQWKYHATEHPTGRNLSQSVFAAVRSGNSAIVSSTSPYAVAVEYGTKPHYLNNGKPVLVKSIVRGRGLQEWKMVKHKGSKGRHYFQKGFKRFIEKDADKLLTEMSKKIK